MSEGTVDEGFIAFLSDRGAHGRAVQDQVVSAQLDLEKALSALKKESAVNWTRQYATEDDDVSLRDLENRLEQLNHDLTVTLVDKQQREEPLAAMFSRLLRFSLDAREVLETVAEQHPSPAAQRAVATCDQLFQNGIALNAVLQAYDAGYERGQAQPSHARRASSRGSRAARRS